MVVDSSLLPGRLFVTCDVFARYFFAAFSWPSSPWKNSVWVFFVVFWWLFRGFFVLGKIYAYSPWNSLLKLIIYSGTGDSQRNSRESIRANHSQLRPPHFIARITRFARITRIPIRTDHPTRANCANRFARITPLRMRIHTPSIMYIRGCGFSPP